MKQESLVFDDGRFNARYAVLSLEAQDSTELDQTLFSFQEITAELNYRKAQNSLRNLIGNIDLTAEEQTGLESEIDRLTQMLDKLEQSVVQIAAFGMVGRGKSSVLNALVGKDIFPTGALHGVTRTIDTANWKLTPETNRRYEPKFAAFDHHR